MLVLLTLGGRGWAGYKGTSVVPRNLDWVHPSFMKTWSLLGGREWVRPGMQGFQLYRASYGGLQPFFESAEPAFLRRDYHNKCYNKNKNKNNNDQGLYVNFFRA